MLVSNIQITNTNDITHFVDELYVDKSLKCNELNRLQPVVNRDCLEFCFAYMKRPIHTRTML